MPLKDPEGYYCLHGLLQALRQQGLQLAEESRLHPDRAYFTGGLNNEFKIGLEFRVSPELWVELSDYSPA